MSSQLYHILIRVETTAEFIFTHHKPRCPLQETHEELYPHFAIRILHFSTKTSIKPTKTNIKRTKTIIKQTKTNIKQLKTTIKLDKINNTPIET